MGIPDYQSLMLPVLQIISDRREHSVIEVSETIAERLKEPLKILPMHNWRG